MPYLPPGVVRFGPFEFDARSRELRKNGMRVKLTPHETSLLSLLLEPPLRVRTRDEIQRHLWTANTYVDFEHGMNKVVHSLREALGDSATNPHYVETVNAAGYRFLPQFLKLAASDKRDLFRDVASIAVLPIRPLDPADLGRADRVTFHLISGLSAFRHRVIAQATLRSFKLEAIAPREAGEMLGVDAVISGELTRTDAGTLSLTAELIDVSDGTLLSAACSETTDMPRSHSEELLARDLLQQFRPLLHPVSDTPQLNLDGLDVPLKPNGHSTPRRRATDFM
jgi:DNA-binding winged helix-turn-helix (wHTH) protein